MLIPELSSCPPSYAIWMRGQGEENKYIAKKKGQRQKGFDGGDNNDEEADDQLFQKKD